MDCYFINLHHVSIENKTHLIGFRKILYFGIYRVSRLNSNWFILKNVSCTNKVHIGGLYGQGDIAEDDTLHNSSNIKNKLLNYFCLVEMHIWCQMGTRMSRLPYVFSYCYLGVYCTNGNFGANPHFSRASSRSKIEWFSMTPGKFNWKHSMYLN